MKELKFLLVAVIGFAMVYVCAELSKSGSKDEIKFKVEGIDGKTYESYQSACRNQDFEAAHRILDLMKKEYEDFKRDNKLVETKLVEKHVFKRDEYEDDHTNEEKYNAMVQSYMEAENYVFNAEILYLVSLNTEESTNRLFFLLSEYQLSGLPPAANVTYDNYYNKDDCKRVKEYIASIARYNGHCNNALDLAISQGNQPLAKRIIHLFKQNVDIFDEETNEIRISPKGVNNTDKEAAQKKYDEAVKAGAFN